MPTIDHTTIFGVRIDTVTKLNYFAKISDFIRYSSETPAVIYTPNPEILMFARAHPEYAELLNAGDLNLPDGIGLKIVQPKSIRHRITGADTVQYILNYASTHNLSVGIIYNSRGLSSEEDIQSAVLSQFSGLTVYTSASTFSSQKPDIVLVALGFPHQEQWIHEHRQSLVGTRLIMGVGGSIDFITGKQQRAPLFLRKVGLEWLWRVIRQPSRIGRIFTAVVLFPLTYLIDHNRS